MFSPIELFADYLLQPGALSLREVIRLLMADGGLYNRCRQPGEAQWHTAFLNADIVFELPDDLMVDVPGGGSVTSVFDLRKRPFLLPDVTASTASGVDISNAPTGPLYMRRATGNRYQVSTRRNQWTERRRRPSRGV